jgi:hypothetical protein
MMLKETISQLKQFTRHSMLTTADTIVAKLKAWCAVERGRLSRVAEIGDVDRSALADGRVANGS